MLPSIRSIRAEHLSPIRFQLRYDHDPDLEEGGNDIQMENSFKSLDTNVTSPKTDIGVFPTGQNIDRLPRIWSKKSLRSFNVRILMRFSKTTELKLRIFGRWISKTTKSPTKLSIADVMSSMIVSNA